MEKMLWRCELRIAVRVFPTCCREDDSTTRAALECPPSWTHSERRTESNIEEVERLIRRGGRTLAFSLYRIRAMVRSEAAEARRAEPKVPLATGLRIEM